MVRALSSCSAQAARADLPFFSCRDLGAMSIPEIKCVDSGGSASGIERCVPDLRQSGLSRHDLPSEFELRANGPPFHTASLTCADPE
jgi:hypothetical protein